MTKGPGRKKRDFDSKVMPVEAKCWCVVTSGAVWPDEHTTISWVIAVRRARNNCWTVRDRLMRIHTIPERYLMRIDGFQSKEMKH